MVWNFKKLTVLALVACMASPIGFAQSREAEGVARQVETMQSGLNSFAEHIRGEMKALKDIIKPCDDIPYAKLNTKECPAGYTGHVLEQCIGGAVSDVFNDCTHLPQRYIRKYYAGTPLASDITFETAVYPRLPKSLVGHPSIVNVVGNGISADANTAKEVCKVMGYANYSSIVPWRYSSCGDNTLIAFRNSSFQLVNACSAGGAVLMSVVCED